MITRRRGLATGTVLATLTVAAVAAAAHWTPGNVNAINQILGARSGWHFDYVPPVDPDHGLHATVQRYPGLDQSVGFATVPPVDPDLGGTVPPDPEHALRILLPADPTADTQIHWAQPPDPERALDIAFPADATSPIVIGLSTPPDPEYPPDPGHPPDPGRVELSYPPDPGMPIEIVIPTGANVVLRDQTGAVLEVCGAVGIPTDTAPN